MTSPPLAARRFAHHALTTRYEDLSDDAVAQAKVFILDTVGVGIAGSTTYGTDQVAIANARSRIPGNATVEVGEPRQHCGAAGNERPPPGRRC
jgi:2-methylcitrate dehydratase PrpD